MGGVVGGTMRHWGGRDDRRMEWSGGGKGTVGIPKGKPAPFDSFKVTATESLWTWWHSAAVESPNQSEPAIKAGENDFIGRLLAGPDDAELSPRELALLEAYLKQPVSLAQMQLEATAEGTSELARRRNKLKLIRDFNRNLQAATPVPGESEPAAEPASQPVLDGAYQTPGWMGGGRGIGDGVGRAFHTSSCIPSEVKTDAR